MPPFPLHNWNSKFNNNIDAVLVTERPMGWELWQYDMKMIIISNISFHSIQFDSTQEYYIWNVSPLPTPLFPASRQSIIALNNAQFMFIHHNRLIEYTVHFAMIIISETSLVSQRLNIARYQSHLHTINWWLRVRKRKETWIIRNWRAFSISFIFATVNSFDFPKTLTFAVKSNQRIFLQPSHSITK